MPDSGTNTYISVAPDGTVVVPNNLTPEGVIVAGDLATHADLDAAVAGLADTAYVDAGDAAVQANVDALAAIAATGAGVNINGPYSVNVNGAGGQDTILQVDAGPYAETGWSTWTVVGDVVPNVICLVAGPEITDNGDGTIKFTFFSMGSGLQTIDANFDFFFVGIP